MRANADVPSVEGGLLAVLVLEDPYSIQKLPITFQTKGQNISSLFRFSYPPIVDLTL